VKVIGVGFGRTGTMSLKVALEQLGAGPCFHMIDLIMGERRARDIAQWVKVVNGEQDWHEVFDGWEATVDWPAASRWREICDAFPDAPVLLNVRELRIAEIKATIAPERLTVWELGVDGWEPLAAMLGVEAPDEPFPRLHDTNEFRTEFGLPAIA
jgi:hypothetical protein